MRVVINAATTVTKTVRIVALHGRGGSGPVFRKKMEPLINMLPQSSLSLSYHIEWHFPNAPHIHDSPSTTTSSIPQSTTTTMPIRNNQKQSPQKYEWWSLPPNTRSFNATEYYGVDESIQLIENLNPHILIGHSQGAMLSSIIVAKAIKHMSSTSASTTSLATSTNKEAVLKVCLPKLAILSCPAYPQPYTHLLRGVNTCSTATSTNAQDTNCIKIDSFGTARESTTDISTTITLLHVLSKQDKTNPYESGLQVAQSFQPCPRVVSNTIMAHEQGHKLCIDESFLQVYTDLIMKAASEVVS